MLQTNNNMALYKNQQYLNNLKPDLQIILNGQKYDAESKKLIKDSKYFQKMCRAGVNTVTIAENFKPKTFENIISMLLVQKLQIQRQEIEESFKIATFLESETVISYLMKDIMVNFSKYSIFHLIKIAHTYNNQQLFEKCMQQLQKQSYIQMQINQLQLIELSQPLFKLILQSHSRFKKNNKTVIQYTEINRILIQFCNKHQLKKKEYTHLKFQLFDGNVLNAQEYEEIFYDQIIDQVQKSTISNNLKLKESLNLSCGSKFDSTLEIKQIKLCKAQSSLSPRKQIGIRSEILVTFLTKKVEYLQSQNNYLQKQLQKIKNMTMENQKIHFQMQKQIQKLKQQIIEKQRRQRQSRNMLKSFEPLLTKLQKQIQKKSKQIDELRTMYEKCKIQKSQKDLPQITNEKINQDPDTIIQSQFLSANFLHQMFSSLNLHTKTPTPLKKNNEKTLKTSIVQMQTPKTMDSEQLSELYINRLEFDQQPICLTKNLLPQLSSMINSDRFLKKRMHLIYRRSDKFQPVGKKQNLYNKNSLIIFIKTDVNNTIGGFISESISSVKNSQIKDNNSYLFNLSKNIKLTFKKNCRQSVSCQQDNLISFAKDLRIPNNCLSQKIKCQQPLSYENNEKHLINTHWVGSEQFFIKDIDIYEVIEAEMEMIL